MLLDDSLRCVITDFGMSRVMASSAVNDAEYYTITSLGPQALPLRWMASVLPIVWFAVADPGRQAPETLQSRKFSKETDVYSFGCVMIEVHPLESVITYLCSVLTSPLAGLYQWGFAFRRTRQQCHHRNSCEDAATEAQNAFAASPGSTDGGDTMCQHLAAR